MIGDVTGASVFLTFVYLILLREKISDKKIRYDANDAKLKGLVNDPEEPGSRLILCAKNTGYWMTIWGTTVTSTVL